VGRLSDEKNVNCLLQAAKLVLEQFPKTLFLIVGDGPERKSLGTLAKELVIEKNFIFEGAVKHKKIPSYYQASDLVVLPSKHEGWGLTLIEAMASGRPPVTTDVGAARELVIDGETGFVVPINDSQALAKKISILINRPQLRDMMSKKGKDIVIETQDIKKNSYKLKEMYEKVLELSI
jgi:glycosyltransferase involved in cell wall biosynthesis